MRTTIRRPILRARWFYVKTWERGTCVAAGRPLLARPADEQNRGGLSGGLCATLKRAAAGPKPRRTDLHGDPERSLARKRGWDRLMRH